MRILFKLSVKIIKWISGTLTLPLSCLADGIDQHFVKNAHSPSCRELHKRVDTFLMTLWQGHRQLGLM